MEVYQGSSGAEKGYIKILGVVEGSTRGAVEEL